MGDPTRYRIHRRSPDRWRLAARLIVLALVSVVGVCWPVARVAAMPIPYRVERGLTIPLVGDGELALSGSWLLWQEQTPTGPTRITGLDLRTNQRLPLPTAKGNQRQPVLTSTLAAWIEQEPNDDRASVIVYDLDIHRRLAVSSPGAVPDLPAIDGVTVVWRDRRDGRWSIFGYDLVEGREFLIASSPTSLGAPSVSGPLVVWEGFRGNSWDIFAHDRASGRTWTLIEGAADQVNPRVERGRVVYEERPPGGGPASIKVLTVAGGATKTIAGDHLAATPALAGSLVVWEDWRDGIAGIFAYDLDEGIEIPITRSEQARRPVVDGQTIAWLNLTPFATAIAVANLRPILPSERRDSPLQADPNVLYFPETGHTLGFGFKTFWQQHGGLPVLGYPLTEEYREVERSTGKARNVQFFERFQLEYDPTENEPSRRVRATRLGVDWRRGQELPREAPEPDTPDQRYFPETGFLLPGRFKQYWDTHDGFVLLGMPITPPLEEGGRTVQYFERGRLELVPGANGERARPEAGLLGREILMARGWLPGGQAPPRQPSARPLR